jgi:hypothetical protein
LQISDWRLQISPQAGPEIFNLKSSISNLQSEIVLLCSLYHHFAQQAVGKTAGGNHGDIAAYLGNHFLGRGEIQGLVL